MLKRTEVIAVKETYQGSLLINLAHFFTYLEGNSLEYTLQSLNRVMDFSQKKRIRK